MPSGSPIHTPLCDHNVTRHVRAPHVPGPTRRGRAAKHSVAAGDTGGPGHAVTATRQAAVRSNDTAESVTPARPCRSLSGAAGRAASERAAPRQHPRLRFSSFLCVTKQYPFQHRKMCKQALLQGPLKDKHQAGLAPQTPVCHSLPAHSSSQEPWTIKANETPKEMEQHDKEQKSIKQKQKSNRRFQYRREPDLWKDH